MAELAHQKRATMNQCPICGGELASKQVDKLLRGGNHTASLTVPAEVCLRCGERLYSPEVIRRFEEIRAKLEKEQTAEFEPIGQSFHIG